MGNTVSLKRLNTMQHGLRESKRERPANQATHLNQSHNMPVQITSLKFDLQVTIRDDKSL